MERNSFRFGVGLVFGDWHEHEGAVEVFPFTRCFGCLCMLMKGLRSCPHMRVGRGLARKGFEKSPLVLGSR